MNSYLMWNWGITIITFIELRSRKSNNTKFLDSLKDALINRMRDSDG
ncbi:RteC domain-containing protein [Maribacter dokdonensis]|nr:RteC domain-containing protein [Maribacter dokdonensis]